MPSGVLLLQHFVHTSCCSHLRIILGFRESWAGLALHNWLKSVCVDLHSHFQRGDYVTELILSCFQSFWKTGTLGHLIIHHLQTSSLIHSMIFYPILRYFQDNVGWINLLQSGDYKPYHPAGFTGSQLPSVHEWRGERSSVISWNCPWFDHCWLSEPARCVPSPRRAAVMAHTALDPIDRKSVV